MSVVTSPFRSSFGPSGSSTGQVQQQGSSIYPSLPGQPQQQQQQQLQRYGQQPQQPQQQQQQLQMQQSTSFGPVSQPQQQQIQPYGYGAPSQQQPQQQQVGSYNTNAFTNSFAFGPQQLANPGQNEVEELSQAGDKVGRGMNADEEISGDLADMMANAQAANVPAYADLPGQSSAYYPFQITQTLPLPDELHTEMRKADIDHKGLTAKMGLFEEIGHAWFVVGSRLFLWNYGDTRDFSRYDEQKDTIEAVGLVKAKRDVFIDDITHILVICTRSSATILGISRTDNKLNFFQTELSCQVPTRMLSITGTNSGRVFMNGENKGLYELEYTNAAGWFFGSSSKIWVTGRLCVPSSFLPMRSSDGVESFIVDPIQNRVFTLHTKGEIRMCEASSNGWMERGTCSPTTLNNALRNAGSSVTKVISIAVIGGNESRRYCLMAMTENGTRIYLSTSSFQGQGSMGYGFPGSTSSCVARPPPQQMASLRFSPKSFYSSGAFIGVQDTDAGPSRSSTLHCYIPNPGVQPALRENRNQHSLSPVWQEWIMSIQNAIKDQVWTIAEVPTTNPVNDPPSLRRSDNLALSALARQTSVEKRQFLILSESALSWAQVTRPVDMLQAGLEVDKDALTVIHDTFGRIQLAAMGVTLGSQGDMKQPDLASAVSHILTAAGGYPVLSENPSGRTITYSARHDGLVLTVARLLRPLWRANVTIMAMGGRQVLNIPAARLQAVQAVLQKLRTFLEQNPFPRHVAQGDAKTAWDQEEMSLAALQSLLKNVIEAISFLDLLDKYKLPDIVAKCDMDVQSMLSRMTFKDFLTTQEGRKVARQLVTNLIEQQIGHEHGIDTLSETLQRECGTFSQPGDVVVYKAEENLRRAEYSRDPNERSECLAESFRLFSKAAKDITPSKVAPIAKRYHDAGFTRGAIELPLQTAAKVDPNDQALDYMRDGMRGGDRRKELYDAREECYKVVTQALGDLDSRLSQATASGDVGPVAARRDEAYAMAINSDDELFHRYLYDWHVNRGLAEQLLEFDTPYIETYLQITAAHEGQEHKDLLWKYYARREEYLPAARALHDLATRDTPPMSLNDRMYYLAQALTSAKSAASLGSEDVEFTSNLQERIDVAQVQSEVGRAIASHKEMVPEEKHEALNQLDSKLLGLDDMYQTYARPFRLYEPILLILKTADTRVEDVCEAVWRQLLREQPGQGYDAMKDAVMRDRLGDLIRRYYPSEAAPLDIVLPVIYEESSSMWQSTDAGWVTTALLDAGVGLRDVWETIADLYERGEEDREFLEEEAGVVFVRWLKEKDSIPAAEVERFASNYLLRLGNEQLDERKQQTRKRMSQAKDAAVRY